MATLNLSTNGPSIKKSYESVVNSPPPSGSAANSTTYGQWAVFSVQAPLANAFVQDAGGKESVLKVQSSGEGELIDLIDEFSDGRVQFAYVKVKDTNTGLPKYALIGWCGEGVPERTKGYFTSHLAAVSKILHGYHVQITARSDRDLTPESIVQKVADASGSKYSGGAAPAPVSSGPPPPVSAKPAFTPTRVGGGTTTFNPLAASRKASTPTNVDNDGWGDDAPPVTRTQLEKVAPAYKPTKVNMAELTSQKQEPSRFSDTRAERNGAADVVRGGYQPIGKVDIAEIRRQARESGQAGDDRPTVVKGAYEPVGKVDIAAIRARAQKPDDKPSSISPAATGTSSYSNDQQEAEPKSLADRSAAFSRSDRLTSLPKPKVSNRFGSSTSSFSGTKAPTPGGIGFEAKPAAPSAPVGTASRTFADQGGKTPAQLWAERKARERGSSGAAENPPPASIISPTSPIASQTSGGGGWKSGYTGKSWAPVQTTHTGKSSASNLSQQRTGEIEPQDEEPTSPVGGVNAIRDRFKGAAPMGAPSLSKDRPSYDEETSAPAPPPLNASTKPNAGGIPIPGLSTRGAVHEEGQEQSNMPVAPPEVPRSPTPPSPPEMRSGSPIRIAMPVARNQEPEVEAPEERHLAQPVPVHAMAAAAPAEEDLPEEQPQGHDPARGAAEAAAAATFGEHAAAQAEPGAHVGGKRAVIQYDYEKAEDNEIDLKEGEYVTNIEMVDEDWWMGQNSQGESGLFPSNYVELVEDEEEAPAAHQHVEAAPPADPTPDAPGAGGAESGQTAIAQYEYEAAEDNELSFPEGAKITGIEFPDDDWWLGEYNGKSGLFPANYVELEQ